MSIASRAKLSPSRQIGFHQLLAGARKNWLIDALTETVGTLDPKRLKEEITEYVAPDAQQLLASSGIRDEHVFATPLVLAAKPMLVGYYRLLLGISQKEFYGAGYGWGALQKTEAAGLFTDRQRAILPKFCRDINEAIADLIRQISPAITARDVHELPLLTLGAQFQGGNNNTIGKKATANLFLSIAEVVLESIEVREDSKLTVRNASGRRVYITLSGDPDVKIQEVIGGQIHNKVAIEIKGGTDKSNAHNRAGEAEKSHQKARNVGFRDFWTIITKKGLSMGKLRAESPTTTSWFDAAQVLGREGGDWLEFRSRLASAVGIPIA